MLRFVVMACISFSSIVLAQRTGPAVSIGPSPDSSVQITPIAPGSPAALALSGSLVGLAPASFLVSNQGSRAILGIVVIWVTPDYTGKQRVHRHSSDSFLDAQLRAVLVPGARMLVAPSVWIPEERIAANAQTRLVQSLQQFADVFSSAASVTVSVDSIIFADGEIVGPDTEHFGEDLVARKQAAASIVDALNKAKQAGLPPLDVATQISKAPIKLSPSAAKHSVELWRQEFAGRLVHEPTDAFDRELLKMQQMPEVSVHRALP